RLLALSKLRGRPTGAASSFCHARRLQQTQRSAPPIFFGFPLHRWRIRILTFTRCRERRRRNAPDHQAELELTEGSKQTKRSGLNYSTTSTCRSPLRNCTVQGGCGEEESAHDCEHWR